MHFLQGFLPGGLITVLVKRGQVMPGWGQLIPRDPLGTCVPQVQPRKGGDFEGILGIRTLLLCSTPAPGQTMYGDGPPVLAQSGEGWAPFYFFGQATQHAGPSLTRDRTWAPAAEAQSLNHWTTREVHRPSFVLTSLSLYLCFPVSVSLSLFLSLSVYLCLSLSLSLCLFVSVTLPFQSTLGHYGEDLRIISEACVHLKGSYDIFRPNILSMFLFFLCKYFHKHPNLKLLKSPLSRDC